MNKKRKYIGEEFPELIKYFLNKDEAFKYTCGSNQNVIVKCDKCNYERPMAINNLAKRKFNCPMCSDKASFSEKLMRNILIELKINFIPELSKSICAWCGKYKYDFYIPENKIIIEMNGSQHYGNTFPSRSYMKQKEADEEKRLVALKNGINPDKYIIIKVNDKENNYNLQELKRTILNSNLSLYYNLNLVNIETCFKKALSIRTIQVCKFYEDNKQLNDFIVDKIANNFNISIDLVRRDLNIGTQCKICTYNGKENIYKAGLKGNKIASEKLKHKINVFKDGKFILSCESARYLYKHAEDLLGMRMNYQSICSVCRGKQKSYKGYQIFYEDIEKNLKE